MALILVHSPLFRPIQTPAPPIGRIAPLLAFPCWVGNVDFIDDNLDSSKDKDFSYDALNRLEGATGPWGTLGWTYDNVGNRETYTDPSGTTDYDYFLGTNRLRALTGATTANFTYDPSGNTDTEGTRDYIYNENNRLIHVNDGPTVGTYSYDAKGRRITKTTGASTAVFHHSDMGQLISEVQADGSVIAEYIYLIDQPIGKAKETDLHFVHNDHLATPSILTDSSGSAVWEVEMKPFGDASVISGSTTMNLRFPGQYFDEKSGLNHNHNRYYDPTLGRYIRPDPYGVFGGTNLYSYVANNPLRYTDGFDNLVWSTLLI